MKLMKLVQQQSGLSRRKSRDLVDQGEVEVNGEVDENPFAQYELDDIDSFYLRGHPLPTYPPKLQAYRFYKPQGILCSSDDPHYGRTIGRFLRSEGFIGYRWAGRLDQDAEGLLLLSNDGQLVHSLTHPRYEVEKRYHVWVSGRLDHGQLGGIIDRFMKGIVDDGEELQVTEGSVVERGSEHTRIELVLTEGKKNEIKRLLAAEDLNLVRLRRISIGPVDIGDLSPGEVEKVDPGGWRELQKYKEEARERREES
ncbi:MAG: pseudouridine synthase [Candidatus Acetothermia bacterium]